MPDNVRPPDRKTYITAERAFELEQSLLDKADDLDARNHLLVYYSMQWAHLACANDTAGAEAAHKQKLHHALWVIEPRPDTELAGAPYVVMQSGRDDDAIPRVKQLWVQNIAIYPNNALVLGNAAQFFIYSSQQYWPKAHELLNAAEQLDPVNSEWPERLGWLIDFERRDLTGPEAVGLAQQGLKCYERAIERTPKEVRKVLILGRLAPVARAAEQFAKASTYATELLVGAPLCNTDGQPWMYGNALHIGHIVLGKVALHEEDTESAVNHLLEAENTPGSPQLNSFGPDFSLARELLERGERNAVTDYLKACSKFWELGKSRLTQWVTAIRQDRTPDFNMSCRM